MDAEVSPSRLVFEAIPKTGATFRELCALTGKPSTYVEIALKALKQSGLVELRAGFKSGAWFKVGKREQDEPMPPPVKKPRKAGASRRKTRVVNGVHETWCNRGSHFVPDDQFGWLQREGRVYLAHQCKPCAREREKARGRRYDRTRYEANGATERRCIGNGGHFAPLNRFSIADPKTKRYALKCRDCLRSERA